MRTLNHGFPADRPAARRAHVGVAGSGDPEILMAQERAAASRRVREALAARWR
ncbi:hypothetical protein [Streptosporangium sp. OZ121]|uniref:hypothetical protein n=1 Tax=Streptosporangium sp. OZ121 TaxID=3444183 RepID=UPI003F78D043